MRIDHVIYAAPRLDETAARLQAEHGLVAHGGGRHVGLGRALATRIRERGEGLLGWVVAVEDVVAEASRTGAELSVIERAGLRARLAGVSTAMAEPALPFFIERDPGIADPGEGGDAGGISWIEVAGDAARLRAWVGGAELPVRVREGEPA